VGAVAGVDYGNFQMASHEIGRAGRGVAHHEAVGSHGVEVVGGVEERLAFFQAGGFGLKIHRVRAQARCGGGEAKACACGIFKEGESNCFAAQSGEFFEGVALNFLERFGLIENEGEFVRGERFKSQQIAKSIGQICTRLYARRSAPRLIG